MMLEELVIRLGLNSRFSDGIALWLSFGAWTIVLYAAIWHTVTDQHLRDRLTVNVQGSIPRILWDTFCVWSRILAPILPRTLNAEVVVGSMLIVLLWPWMLQGIFIGSLRYCGILKDFSENLSEL